MSSQNPPSGDHGQKDATSSTNSPRHDALHAERKAHPMFKYLGIPDHWATWRPKLPSRNWMIFYTVSFAFTGLYYYDRREAKRRQLNLKERVRHLYEKPVSWDSLPRRVIVYLSPAPNDTIERKWDYFRDFVKPILIAAAIDYDVKEGVEPGDLRGLVAREIELRKKFERGEIDPTHMDPDPNIQRYLYSLAAKKHGEIPHVIVIGRSTLMEYLAGLHDGELAVRKKNITEEENNDHTPGTLSIPEMNDNEFVTAPGGPINTLESKSADDEKNLNPSKTSIKVEIENGDKPESKDDEIQPKKSPYVPLPHTYLPENSDGGDLVESITTKAELQQGEKNKDKSQSRMSSLLSWFKWTRGSNSNGTSSSDNTTSTLSGKENTPILIHEEKPIATVLFVPYDYLIGWRNTPERLRRFFDRKSTIDKCGKAVLALALSSEMQSLYPPDGDSTPLIRPLNPEEAEKWGVVEESRWFGNAGKSIREEIKESGAEGRTVQINERISRRLFAFPNPENEKDDKEVLTVS